VIGTSLTSFVVIPLWVRFHGKRQANSYHKHMGLSKGGTKANIEIKASQKILNGLEIFIKKNMIMINMQILLTGVQIADMIKSNVYCSLAFLKRHFVRNAY